MGATFVCLLAIHAPLLHLPYYWDEAGYYIPAAFDFYRRFLLIPTRTEPVGHTPLLSIYLGTAWHILGFSTAVTRAAMVLVATFMVGIAYETGRRIAGTEVGIWSGLLLAVYPLFFAQSSLAFLDLLVALFTSWAVLALLEGQWLTFAVAASLAEMSKETAVIMLPVAWTFVWWRRRERRTWAWITLAAPLIPLCFWAVYYHAKTGFWTGNAQYLQYNLYATLTPLRICRSFLARCEEVFLGGFNGLLTLAATGTLIWLRRRNQPMRSGTAGTNDFSHDEKYQFQHPAAPFNRKAVDLMFLTTGLGLVYVILLSMVGGAILPRYMLPVFPGFFLVAVLAIMKLPKRFGRSILAATAVAFVICWFWNPPYPFPFEDNLAYADFIHLHQRAAAFLEAQPQEPRILTAWPATNELQEPLLGYVAQPLNIKPIDGFTPRDFTDPPAFDLLYLYSRKWEPPGNPILRSHRWRHFLLRFYDYTPQASDSWLISRFHLKLLRQFQKRGQWVRIYTIAKTPGHGPGS